MLVKIFIDFQPTQSIIDALRLADQVSCPYERRYKKHKRYQQKSQANSIARSMPTLIEDQHFAHVSYNARVSIGATEFLVSDEEAARLRAMENRTGSVGDCTKLASYRSNKPAFFRRRSTRRRISNAQRLADLEDFINTRVQASDGNFFEKVTAPSDGDTARDDELYTIKNLSIVGDKKQIEALYVEALYTITHKLGQGDVEESQESLYKYVRNAFQGDAAVHNALMEKAKQNKPPSVLLNILLLEAKDLIAKDVNGFSDPFAMMGVVPGTRKENQPMTDSAHPEKEEQEAKSPRALHGKKDGLMHRFGGSFRRKVGKKGKPQDTGTIPAKLIKASSVQKKTLNPKWSEKFQFTVEDVQRDQFHIDIWDHDDEEQSVLDAVSSLNQITGGFKGIGRYFKEVTQSARANSDDCTDDFLGCINMKLAEIPPDGLEQWFTLQPRSDKSKVSGQVKLKIWLSTKEEGRAGDEDETLDVKEHIELLRQFALYEIRQTGQPVRFWDGVYPERAMIILRQHAIQGDLTDVHLAMCRWLAFHSMIHIDISFSLLYKTLQKIIDKWQPLTLDKEEEDMLTDSFSSFDSYCKRMMIEHREKFTPSKRNSGEEFSSLIKCMRALRESPFYQKYLPYKRPFHAHLESLVVKSAEDFIDRSIESVQDPDPCKELLQLLNIVNTQCSRFLHYAAVIREVARIDYSQLTLNTFDRLLTEYLTSELMSEKKMDLKSQMRLSAAQDPPNEDDLIDLMRIHMAFVELRNYRLANRVRVRDESEWYAIFNKGIKKFLEVAKEKALARVHLSCQLDMPISTSSNDMRHSSSHIDICHIIEQFTVFWERVDINDAGLKIEYTRQLVDVICEIVTVYTQKIISGLEAEGFTQELQAFIPSQLLHLLCAAINNCEQVRRSLNITEKLHMDDMSLAYERDASRLNGNHMWKSEIENRLESCESNICSEIDRIVGLLTERRLPQMKKHVFHLAWSPSAQLVEDSLKPLTDMLDIELSSVHKNLLHRNFLRVMSAQVSIVVKLLRECVTENVGMEPAFYHRLFEAWHVLVEFFHAGGKGLSMDALDTNPEHMKLVKILSLNQTPTEQLIEKYYKDLLKQQNEVSECKYGILNVRAYYNGNAQTLVLDIIGAKQIIALDSNGLSDPFVVIEIIPKFRYPAVPVVKTKVVSKSLNPIFDETFEFHIPPNPPSTAMLHFTVMDHDYLRSNDFAGEAFLELNDVPGFGATGGSTLRQFNLILIQPVSNTKDVLDVLNSRKEDKDAVEFLRSISTVY
ncbi:BAI1-associated protein 3 [Caenorhabditis elegans]|uniref:BAI1-associated protein 3 n=1 Tax=Caenorhabditis elegans TaxID=6239 RepID=Q400L7_CAEEL|nr:BAI1-associated protein 3 [Caenorhabditis elegans]CCD63796.1 BAI1-associated protein 3 [Caenorhabditis elegans]|eukprot:NP_001024711.1 Uncharacterized protein CELE_F54G2.1 [Caenorhabditis elegans]